MAAAKVKNSSVRTFSKKPRRKRPGVVSKKGSSSNKRSKLYKKPYNGQGH
jgi:hypothetical protein